MYLFEYLLSFLFHVRRGVELLGLILGQFYVSLLGNHPFLHVLSSCQQCMRASLVVQW